MTEHNEEHVAPIDEDVTAAEEEQQEEIVEETTVEEVDPVKELEESLSEMEDKFLRAQAEIANMRNRFQKEREGLLKYRSQDLGKELLTALDNLERALDIEVSEETGESLKKGIEMVYESFIVALKNAGIEEIKALGETFDPNVHQAVQTVPLEEGQQADEVVTVLQKGYELHDRVLRPSMVIVAQ